jgi:hypothetical protein
VSNYTPKFQLKLNEESEIDFKLSIEGSVSDQNMTKPVFRFVMTENSSDRGWVFPVKTKYKGSDIFTVKIPALNESAVEDVPYNGRLEVIMGNLIMIPSEVLLEFKRPFNVKAEVKPDISETTTPEKPKSKEKTIKEKDSLEEDIDAVISIAKPPRPKPSAPTMTMPLVPTPPPSTKNPMLFNNVMFLEEQAENPKKTNVKAQNDVERQRVKSKLKNLFKQALK